MNLEKFTVSEPENTAKDKEPINPETWAEKVKEICTGRWGQETERAGIKIDLLCTEFKKYLDATREEEEKKRREKEIRPLFLNLVERYVGSPKISEWEEILFKNQKNKQKVARFREGLFAKPVFIPPYPENGKKERK